MGSKKGVDGSSGGEQKQEGLLGELEGRQGGGVEEVALREELQASTPLVTKLWPCVFPEAGVCARMGVMRMLPSGRRRAEKVRKEEDLINLQNDKNDTDNTN